MLDNKTNSNKTKNINNICGIDEVGRGCLAGPVYSGAVVLDQNTNFESKDFSQINDSKKLKTIYAAVITESKSQKGIILGKQGSMIKAIGTAARKELEKEFSKKVNLQLWVKANKNWTNDINKLKKFGLGVDF